MSDDLRDRIAAVIQSHLTWDAPNLSGHLADAVIAELYPQRQCHICGRSGTQQFVACDSGWVCRSVFACEVRRLNG